MEMKLIFFILVLLKNGLHPTKGIQLRYSTGRITLRYFRPYLNILEISCCKFDQLLCYPFVNNKGHVHSLYQGRLYSFNRNGQFTVVIRKLSVLDAGIYGCGFTRDINTFEYVHVTVSDLRTFSGVNTAPLSPKSSITPAIWSSSPSTPSVSEEQAQKSSVFWSTLHTLAVVLSVLVVLVMFFTLLVYRLKRKKPTDKSGTCGSSNSTMEQNSITYSMVEFKPLHDPYQIYANLQIHHPEDTACSLRCTVIPEESVEYSSILTSPA